MAEFEKDGWQLASGEKYHARSPQTFEIPERSYRDTLPVGASAQLMFQIDFGPDEQGGAEVGTERMWVLVTDKVGDTYLGTLSNKPATVGSVEGFHLGLRAEIPFRAEHVIDINYLPPEQVAEALAQGPSIKWPRE